MRDKYKIAIIGTGVVANFMASFLLMQEDFELVWVASQTRSHAESFAKAFFVKNATDNYMEIPTDEVDIVYVATWADQHVSITEYFLDRGVHVLCEKPYTLTPDVYRGSRNLAGERGVCLLVNIVTAFVPGFDRIAEVLRQYGPVHAVEISMGKRHVPDDSKLFGDPLFGGVYRDLSSYVFCFLRRVFGRGATVKRAVTQRHVTGVDVATRLTLGYEKGPDISCELTFLEDVEVCATFRMERGVLRVGEFARVGSLTMETGGEVQTLYEAKHRFMGFEYVFDAIRAIVDGAGEAYRTEYETLFEGVTHDIQQGMEELK